jgi:hypothetical protein
MARPGSAISTIQGSNTGLVQHQQEGKSCLLSISQTCPLMKLQPVSFGFEALAHQIEDEAENNGWTLAKHFKLHLQPNTMRAKHNSKLNSGYNILHY